MERSCILTLVREIQHSHKYKSYYNIPGKLKQSSVAFVLRVSPAYEKCKDLNQVLHRDIKQYNFQKPEESQYQFTQLQQTLEQFNQAKFQCILIQRQIDPKDFHSGQLAFPGGHVDNSENDFQSSVREVSEEIGLKLDMNSLYLGKLPKNFYARKARTGENLYTSLNIFLYVSQEEKTVFTKQEKEVRDVKWIDMSKLFEVKQDTIQIYKFAGQFNINTLPSILKNQGKNAINHFKYGEFCSIEIGMDNVLWGLTFHFFIYILSLIKTCYIEGSDSNSLSCINNLIKQSDHYNLVFDQHYTFGLLINFITKRIHQSSRSKQFRFQSAQELQIIAKRKYFCLSLVSLITAGAVAYPFYRSSL